jgi:luciferase family oxidoreductase group 1
MLPLSVLDLSFVTSGTPPSAALRNSLDLAPLADKLGYTRYWFAEHHNLPSIASSSPDIMIGQASALTKRIRLGSGGVMLPNHAPLVVSERFKTLEALFPGRIDLGLGRAPGTDPVAAHALRRHSDPRPGDDFLERLQELMLWDKGFPENHPFRAIQPMPSDARLPPIWILGSSGYGAQLAAMIGTGFAFAQHFASYDATTAMQSYRHGFKPSPEMERPHAILGVAAICADTDEEAERLASTADLNVLRRDQGEYAPLPSPQEALAYPYTQSQRERIQRNRARLFVGSPRTLRERLDPLLASTGADEVMITSPIYDFEAKKRSYALLAETYCLTPT